MRRALTLVGILLIVALAAVTADLSLQEQEASFAGEGIEDAAAIRGIWAAERYLLAGGETLDVRGRIVFGEDEWQVLYFVVDSAGAALRGSGEGGPYGLRGDTVVFRHGFLLQAGDSLPGLGATPLRMEVTPPGETAREPTRFEIDGDALTLFFPSGNRMTFRRVEHR